MPQLPNALIITPTYNERENVPILIERLHQAVPDAHVLVVDDNSPDQTGDVVEQLRADHPNLHLLRRAAKQGLGTAYKDAFTWALERGYRRIVHLDADLSHPPEVVPQLLALSEECDLAIGSRYVRGGGVVGWPVNRKIISRCANFYARTMLRLPVRDLTAGFMCWRPETLRAIGYETLKAGGYVFLVETKWRTVCMGFRVRELPIVFKEREKGASKMGLHIAREGFTQVFKWAMGPRPTKSV